MKVLVVDDEENIRKIIKEYLENESIEVLEADDGDKVEDILKNNQVDIMVLDIMMRGLDGFSLMQKNINTPTIFLSARDSEVDKLTAFSLGADDYMTQPFSPRELVARVIALYKRSCEEYDIYSYKGLSINKSSHIVEIDGKNIFLTPKEYEILIYLISNKNIVVTREGMLSKIWGYDFFGDNRTVDTHIKMLRNNLGKYRDLIVTVRGVGYRYEEKI